MKLLHREAVEYSEGAFVNVKRLKNPRDSEMGAWSIAWSVA